MSWVFDHSSRGSCHLKEGEQSLRAKKFLEEGEQSLRAKTFLAMESVNSLRIQRHNGDLSAKGETGSVKGETKSANFWQGKVGNGKCELIANFSATMVTSPRRERREV